MNGRSEDTDVLDFAVGVIDVGSPMKEKLGWAILAPGAGPETGANLDDFIDRMGELGSSWPLAIGFEAPLFIPMRVVARDITNARRGEGAHAWTAGVGASVLATGLAVATYSMTALRRLLPDHLSTLDFDASSIKPGTIILFEAFVTGQAKGKSHMEDALIAAVEAKRLLARQDKARSAIAEPDVLSLVGATLLRTGWSMDTRLLSSSCFVVKPVSSGL
jgi:hypothetical protein